MSHSTTLPIWLHKPDLNQLLASYIHSTHYKQRLDIDWLPETKFYPPSSDQATLLREPLLSSLHEDISRHRVTILTAPAGYGKSTLLANYYFQYDQLKAVQLKTNIHQGVVPPTLRWLSVDQSDNNLALFWYALLKAMHLEAALATLESIELVSSALSFNPVPTPLHVQVLAGILVNALLRQPVEPLILLLDDCHLLSDPSIYQLLEILIERLPDFVHIVISARCARPFLRARLKSRGQVVEYRARELAFDLQESEQLLTDCYHLPVDPATLALVHTCSEGWPTGLRFLAMALQAMPTEEHEAYLQACLQHTRRWAMPSYLYAYIWEEVLKSLSEELRQFLIHSAFLGSFTTEQCAIFTGSTHAEEFLKYLCQQNLFLEAVPNLYPDNKQKTSESFSGAIVYRYHPLMARILYEQLRMDTPSFVQQLHKQALQLPLPLPQKMHHAILGAAWEWISQSLTDPSITLATIYAPATILRWLNALPHSLLNQNSNLLYLQGYCYWVGQDYVAATEILKAAFALGKCQDERPLQGAILTYWAASLCGRGDRQEAISVLKRAYEFPLTTVEQVQLQLTELYCSTNSAPISSRHYADGKREQTLPDFLRYLNRRGERAELRQLHLMAGVQLLGSTQLCQEIVSSCEHALTLAPDNWWWLSIMNLLGWAKWLQGETPLFPQPLDSYLSDTPYHIDLAQWDEEIPHLRYNADTEATYQIIEGHPAIAEFLLLKSFIAIYQEDYGCAHASLTKILRQPCTEPLWFFTKFTIGRLFLESNEFGKAEEIYQEVLRRHAHSACQQGEIVAVFLGGLLAFHAGNYLQAEQLLYKAVLLEPHVASMTMLYSPTLILATFYLRTKSAKRALELFIPFLTRCQQQQTPVLIYQAGDHAYALLRATVRARIHLPIATELLNQIEQMKRKQGTPISAVGPLLSRQEKVILHLLTNGASNRLIAEQLGITIPTVKSHLSHLFRKLNVSNRQDAAACGRMIGAAES